MQTHLDDSVRDRLIGRALLPLLNSHHRSRLFRHFREPGSLDAASLGDIASLLTITLHDAALVRDPLQADAIRIEVERLRHEVLTIIDPLYPALLRESSDPPAVLFFQGRLDAFALPAIAVVGSRSASVYGVQVARLLARELAVRGVTVVSGLARGVDAAAHRAALEAGGVTAAILGTGIDVIYPRYHTQLAGEIAQRGFVATELAPGTQPRAHHFPIRNRIIAGLCLGTIVVEAAARSGSLITARLALEEGREVFAVPGSILRPGSEGAHRLIQSGAKLVHSIDDVLEEIHELAPLAAARPRAHLELTPEERRTAAAFALDEGTHVDEAARALETTPAAIAATLLSLELKGVLRAVPGSRYVREVGVGDS